MACPSRARASRLAACSLLKSSPVSSRPLKNLIERMPPSRMASVNCLVSIPSTPAQLCELTNFDHKAAARAFAVDLDHANPNAGVNPAGDIPHQTSQHPIVGRNDLERLWRE